MPKKLCLGLIRIGRHAAEEELARAGNIGKALCKLAAGAAFGSGKGHFLFKKSRITLSSTVSTSMPKMISPSTSYMLDDRLHHLLGLLDALGLGGDLQQAVALSLA